MASPPQLNAEVARGGVLGTLPNHLSRGQHLLLESFNKTYCYWEHGAWEHGSMGAWEHGSMGAWEWEHWSMGYNCARSLAAQRQLHGQLPGVECLEH